MKPLILINFKTYPEALGKKAYPLARTIATVKGKYQIAIAPTLLTLKEISKINIPIYAQHADPVMDGAHTGHISLKELKALGCQGVILNHSEKKVPLPILEATIKLCKKLNLTTVICASTLRSIRKITKFKPQYIAYEPRKLIGGEISVTSAKPGIILKAVEMVKKHSRTTHLLVGAGIHTKEDVGQSLILGASGVLIGHSVPKAKHPAKFLKNLLT